MRETAPDRDRAAFAPMLAKVLDDFKDLATGLPNLHASPIFKERRCKPTSKLRSSPSPSWRSWAWTTRSQPDWQ